MGILIDTTDFVGQYQIASNNFTKPQLEAYITQNEKRLLDELLGCDLETAFQADLVNKIPQTQIYIDIYNPICVDDTICNEIIESFGMVDMLVGFIYFLFVRDQNFVNTTGGTKRIKGTNSDNPAAMAGAMNDDERQNRAIQSHKAIQRFIELNKTDYPTFNGVEKGYSFFGGAI